MTALIVISIYLVGAIIVYFLSKYSPYGDDKKMWQFHKPTDYTVRDRMENLKASLFSWIVVLLWLIVLIIVITPQPKKGWWKEYLDKPAKW